MTRNEQCCSEWPCYFLAELRSDLRVPEKAPYREKKSEISTFPNYQIVGIDYVHVLTQLALEYMLQFRAASAERG